MDFIQILVLAIVQGLTEFLPISSSAHLILIPRLLGWEDQGVAFDVAVHVGTLTAVLWYFRHDLIPLFNDWLQSIRLRQHSGDSTLAWGVLLGTIPVGLAGLLLKDYVDYLRDPLVIAATTLIFGALLWYADSFGRKQYSEHQLTWKAVIIIGLAQAVALIPGTSRSGITMTAALMLGYTRKGAARFSFLLSIPVILLAGGLETLKLIKSDQVFPWNELILGIIFSAVSASLCIHYFIKLLDTVGMKPFIIYRLLLGVFLLWMFL